MICEKCGRDRISIPCPNGRKGCLVLHLTPCICSQKTSNSSNNQHPEVIACKGEEKCSKSVSKITEDVAVGKVTRNPPVDTDALRNPVLDTVTPLDGRRLNSTKTKRGWGRYYGY